MKLNLTVRCPHCKAGVGAECVTAAGNPPREPHRRRWDELRDARKSRPAVYRLRDAQPNFGLESGDLLLCTPYPYDAKQTVQQRLSDGYVPDCNQYNSNLDFIAFADEYDLDQTVVEEATRYLRQARSDYGSVMRRLTGGILV